jgi:hypothetical protein
MPSFSQSSNYVKNNGTDYNPLLKPTIVRYEPRPYYPYPIPEQHVLSNFDISGTVSVDRSVNPQIADPGLRWIGGI